jgi:hypothetical protein
MRRSGLSRRFSKIWWGIKEGEVSLPVPGPTPAMIAYRDLEAIVMVDRLVAGICELRFNKDGID